MSSLRERFDPLQMFIEQNNRFQIAMNISNLVKTFYSLYKLQNYSENIEWRKAFLVKLI
jgi:hypothetical protein